VINPVSLKIRFTRQWISARKRQHILSPKPCHTGKIFLHDHFSQDRKCSTFQKANPGTKAQKDIFYIDAIQACPTNVSDCGSLRSHNLTLFVMHAFYNQSFSLYCNIALKYSRAPFSKGILSKLKPLSWHISSNSFSEYNVPLIGL